MDDKNIQEEVIIGEGKDKPDMVAIHEGPTQPEERVQFNDKLEELTDEADDDSDETKPVENTGFFLKSSKKFMKLALEQAKMAFNQGEVPVGAVLVKNGKVIARSYNKRETEQNTLSHAELNVISEASSKLGDWRLNDCELYVTVEPCPMCLGAILQTNIKKLVYGASEPNFGAVESKTNLLKSYESKLEVYPGVLERQSENLMKKFFQKVRNKTHL